MKTEFQMSGSDDEVVEISQDGTYTTWSSDDPPAETPTLPPNVDVVYTPDPDHVD